MSAIRLNVAKLRAEIAVRGVTNATFANAANISNATLANALKGRPVSITTLRRIAAGMTILPEVSGLAELIDGSLQNEHS